MWRVLEIAGDGYFLHVNNRNIFVEKDGEIALPIAFADVNSIICHGKNLRFSESFLEGCLKNEIPLTFCDEKHIPLGILLPFYQHTDSLQRIEKQITAKLPKKKQAWQLIIKAKINAQAKVLHYYGKQQAGLILKSMSDHVLSGDSSNLEAQAAKLYFTSLFGKNFIRADDDDSINILLNYGYSIIRSSVARAVVSCGLYPGFGVFHSGRINPFCLVDDLMEPLRPLADKKVFDIYKHNENVKLTPPIKKDLISLATENMRYGKSSMELSTSTRKYVMEYLSFISGDSRHITFPEIEDT